MQIFRRLPEPQPSALGPVIQAHRALGRDGRAYLSGMEAGWAQNLENLKDEVRSASAAGR
jgi:hypothetical protein